MLQSLQIRMRITYRYCSSTAYSLSCYQDSCGNSKLVSPSALVPTKSLWWWLQWHPVLRPNMYITLILVCLNLSFLCEPQFLKAKLFFYICYVQCSCGNLGLFWIREYDQYVTKWVCPSNLVLTKSFGWK